MLSGIHNTKHKKFKIFWDSEHTEYKKLIALWIERERERDNEDVGSGIWGDYKVEENGCAPTGRLWKDLECEHCTCETDRDLERDL